MLKKTINIFIIISLFSIFLFFYYKYVPLLRGFQLILVPILVIVFFLTLISIEWGILFFIFSFPLINNLPYFFGIYEHIPHAPTALILFLAFLLGCVLNKLFYGKTYSIKYEIFKPLILISIIIVISGIITFFRYTNFSLIKLDAIYDLTVNVEGTKSGGALMSTVFNSLNYLTGFIFFFILVNTLKSKNYLKKVIITLSISTCISLVFGLYQHFICLSLGNLPSKIKWASIAALNSTFKDGNSFGAYLAFFIPFVLGLFFAFKGVKKIFFIILLMLAFFILPFTGSISGILCVILSLIFFSLCLIIITVRLIRKNQINLKKAMIISVICLLVVAIFSSILLISKDSSTFNKLKKRIGYLQKNRDWYKFSANKIDYYWIIAGNMMKNYPLSGIGIGAYIIELSNYAKITNKPIQRSDSAENYFLQAGAELGVFALVLFFWVFWEVLKQMKKCFRKYLTDNSWKYIVLGICSGIISFFGNFLLHSYIGSYEIKYTFWLLLGMLFSLNYLKTDNEKPKLKMSKRFTLISLLILSVFTANLTWSSIHSLSLEARTKKFGLKQDFGFYREEHDGKRTFKWTKKIAALSIEIKDVFMNIPILASHPDIEKNPINVHLYIIIDFFKEKKALGIIQIRDRNWHIYKFRIPEELFKKEVVLIIEANRTWQPYKELGTPDIRKLGVAIGEVEFEKVED